MFTWICPKCGREVGPHYSECPYCAELANAETKPAAAPVAVPTAPAPVPQAQYPPQPQYPPPAAPAPPVAQAPPPPPPPPVQQTYLIGADEGRKLPGWLAAVLAFAVVGAVAFGVIYMTSRDRVNGAKAEKAAAKAGSVGNPYAKYLEFTGFRINEAKGKKLQVQFLAVNHGAADLADISGEITLQVKGSPDDEPACRFKFTISNVPGYGAKEILVTDFIQRRKFFEMPDWQFLEPVVDISSSDD